MKTYAHQKEIDQFIGQMILLKLTVKLMQKELGDEKSKDNEIERLSKEFKDYIDFLEKELETPITIISVGPNRDQTIIRNK